MLKDIQIKKWFNRNKDQKNNEVDKVLGVEYVHLRLANEDDFYITRYGLPFIENLKPENFLADKQWFKENSTRLKGTSCVFKVRTKEVEGASKDIVIKWNRMGQDIPGSTDTEELMFAEFNSPFEEFSLVIELKKAMDESSEKITIQTPLAIYVPNEPVKLWQSGRKEYKFQWKLESHKEIALDMFRSYAVIYEWINGVDVAQAYQADVVDEAYMKMITVDAEKKMATKGFLVSDNKPNHVIVNPENKDLVLDQTRDIYALVDFELLRRTSEREKKTRKNRRLDYLKRQRDRFTIEIPKLFHPHLSHVKFFGVDYVYGHVESTKGRLWVVGKDPYLFDYFLPERWEQIPKTKISVYNDMYYTVTKDGIYLAWKVSKVGQLPDMDPFNESEKRILDYGYNSPFEEVAIAVELGNKGIASIYPRAIYMTWNKSDISGNLCDDSRYESHKDLITPDGMPILMKHRDYMIIWGYWNGPDEKLAAKDGDYYEGIDSLEACRNGMITQQQYITLLQEAQEELLQAGIDDLNFRGNHLLISYDDQGDLVMDHHDRLELRVCNFEFLK